jgi:acetylornithine/N-succinyldiaminopimelate aminotransferase
VTADTVVRLLPPLIYTRADAQMAVDILAPLITTFLAQQSTSPAVAPAAQSA